MINQIFIIVLEWFYPLFVSIQNWQVQRCQVLLRISDGMIQDTFIQHLWQDLSLQAPSPTDMEGMNFME